MSAESGGMPGPHNSEQNPQPSESNEEAGGAERSPALDDEDWSEGTDKDCVVCQNATVNRVLLPCRHACACDNCVSHVQHCPICRAFILESFVLTRQAEAAAEQ